MTKNQRAAIEILNRLQRYLTLDEEQAITEDEYFLLLSFVIDHAELPD